MTGEAFAPQPSQRPSAALEADRDGLREALQRMTTAVAARRGASFRGDQAALLFDVASYDELLDAHDAAVAALLTIESRADAG